MCKPKILKLYKAIEKVESQMTDKNMREIPYGNGNPYSYCSECNRSMIEVSYKGHYENCEYDKLLTKSSAIKHETAIELKRFIESGDYLKKSFQHFLWFKKGIHVTGLHIVEQAIKDYEKSKTKHQKESESFGKFIKTGVVS